MAPSRIGHGLEARAKERGWRSFQGEVGAGGGDYGRRSMGAAASGATKRFSLYHFSSMMHVGRNNINDRSVSRYLTRTDKAKVG